MEAYISLGSNLGERERNISKGIELLAGEFGEIKRQSNVYETEAWGEPKQPPFLNCVVCMDTQKTPDELLKTTKAIEQSAGRIESSDRWSPRVLDLDILVYGDKIVNQPDLIIPHPLMAKRKFVLIPLSEIAAQVKVPGHHMTVRDLLNNCIDNNRVVFYKTAGEM